MLIEVRTPAAPLCHFIENVVYHSGYRPPHQKERLLPDGGVNLIIDLGDGAKRTYHNDSLKTAQSFCGGWISGMHQEPITIEAGTGEPMIVVSFKPGGAWAFFGFPMAELGNKVVEMDLIWGRAFRELREMLLSEPTVDRRFHRLEAFLANWISSRMELNPFIDYAVGTIRAPGVPMSMKELAQKLGYSGKHLIFLFDKYLGLPPKRYSRIVRFQKIVQTLECGPPASWASLAHRFGFFDQSHLIKEFKAFAGWTPSRYLGLKGDFMNYVPLFDEPPRK
ncbi:Helix-turn-helix transcriptional regulator [Sulfidibacter corallicola]|uniref:Helix-turn-helix transcriptional regulator n=1 Tax=Sulfidibacter corallicola TaxID=2818388 RepID=A0A8A4TJB2_SULCO|nr:AraC family transcriptional regulator [Sulfidibacter corallicola]QTD50119.1 helix-turn-helix transcriptional regulator [Sulfidibacter corallicola]